MVQKGVDVNHHCFRHGKGKKNRKPDPETARIVFEHIEKYGATEDTWDMLAKRFPANFDCTLNVTGYGTPWTKAQDMLLLEQRVSRREYRLRLCVFSFGDRPKETHT